MGATQRVLWALGAALWLSGCATYMDAKSAVAPGGRIDQQRSAAQGDLQAARSENVRLSDEKLQRERELERNDRRIRAMAADLRRQDQTLAAALKSRKVSQARYTDLKREMDSIRAEMQSVDLQNKGDSFKPADPKADAAKEQRLRELERRKKELEGALAQLATGR